MLAARNTDLETFYGRQTRRGRKLLAVVAEGSTLQHGARLLGWSDSAIQGEKRKLALALSMSRSLMMILSAQHFAGHGAGIHPAMANAPEGEHSALNDLLTIHAVRIAPSPEGHPEFSASAPQPTTDWARIRFGWRAAVGR